jgi:hypothetical protein
MSLVLASCGASPEDELLDRSTNVGRITRAACINRPAPQHELYDCVVGTDGKYTGGFNCSVAMRKGKGTARCEGALRLDP